MTTRKMAPIGYVDIQLRLRVIAPEGWCQNRSTEDWDDQSVADLYGEITHDAVLALRQKLEPMSIKIGNSAARAQLCLLEGGAQFEANDLPDEKASFDYDKWMK